MNFSSWRERARVLLADGVPPHCAAWEEGSSLPLPLGAPMSFRAPSVPVREWTLMGGSTIDVRGSERPRIGGGRLAEFESVVISPSSPIRPLRYTVPTEFLKRAEIIACHRDPSRWHLLYRFLWRLTHGEPQLMRLETDVDTHTLLLMERAVRRDEQRMHAFVRFRRIDTGEGAAYVAWYKPDHHVVRRAAEFFARRFGTLRWTIFTPDESAHWTPAAEGAEGYLDAALLEAGTLTFGPGIPRVAEPSVEELEELWRNFRAESVATSAKDPAPQHNDRPRLLRLEGDLPGSAQTGGLTATRTRRTAGSTEEYLRQLHRGASSCALCPIGRRASCAVQGTGPAHARIVLIGEQPGDEEDRSGRPFVGPAGSVLQRAIDALGIDRSSLYLTHAVKHFKWTRRGRRRVQQRPNSSEITACRGWLMAEIEALNPSVIVCLGVTAAQSVLGQPVRLRDIRRTRLSSPLAPLVCATVHPASVLRTASGEGAFAEFLEDLRFCFVEAEKEGYLGSEGIRGNHDMEAVVSHLV